jgi:ribosomal protein S19E (S16A)
MASRRVFVTDVAAAEYVESLAKHLRQQKVIDIPGQLAREELICFYFQEAARLIRQYYVHPSLVAPQKPRYQGHGPQAKLNVLRQAVQKFSFREFQRIGWIRSDEPTKLLLVTDDGRNAMDAVAQQTKSR